MMGSSSSEMRLGMNNDVGCDCGVWYRQARYGNGYESVEESEVQRYFI